MKRIISSFLILCCLFLMCSCDNTEEVVDTRSLEEIMTEKLKGTSFECMGDPQWTQESLEQMKLYLKENELEEYKVKEIVYLYTGNIDTAELIYTYSFEGNPDLNELKDYMVSHTVSCPFDPPSYRVYSNKYAVYEKYFFITRDTEMIDKTFYNALPLEFEEGAINKQNLISQVKEFGNSFRSRFLEEENSVKVMRSYKEYEEFINEFNEFDEKQGGLFSYYDYKTDDRIFLTAKEYLATQINEEDFTKYNLLFLQRDLAKYSYSGGKKTEYEYCKQEFYSIDNKLEVRHYVRTHLEENLIAGYTGYGFYLIDKTIEFTEVTFTYYNWVNGLDWLNSLSYPHSG